ncbi:MAG: LamG domain-containing protein [Planctomycetota bacterium]
MKKILIIFSVFLFIFAFAASASAAGSSDLVGWWRFDGNADDSTANNLDGVAYGVSYAEGIVGQAASFTGTSYVVVEDNALLEVDDITLEAWVKAEASPGNYKYIAGKRYSGGAGSYALYTGGNGGLRFYINRSGGYTLSPAVTAAVIWDGKWHHVAGTYDGITVRFYVDGVEVVTGTSATGDIVYNDQDFYIGSYGLGYYFNGLIDEVRIWNKALTPAELGDMDDPVVEITAPSNGVCYTTASLPAPAYTVTDANDYAAKEVGYSTDEGNHTYTVTATDVFGYEGSDWVTYTVDDTAPVVTIASPKDGAFYLVGTVPTGSYDVDDKSATIVEAGWSDAVGRHTYTVSATDCAGNVDSDSVTYYVVDNYGTIGGQIEEEVVGKKKDNLRISYGGWAGKAGSAKYGELEVTFHNVSKPSLDKTKFIASSITGITYSDTETDEGDDDLPAPPESKWNKIQIVATGNLVNASTLEVITSGTITINAVDTGEPGQENLPDSIRIMLTAPGTMYNYDTDNPVYANRASIDAGNIQVVYPPSE